MTPPSLSMGLPVYNGENLLREAMNSLLSQSFTNFELIVCDNHSSDSTPDICKYFADSDPRVVCLRNDQNIGAAANFHKVATLARGQYFAWVNHDDLWARTYFEDCISLLTTHPTAVLAYSRASYVKVDNNDSIRLKDHLGLVGSSSLQRLQRFHYLLKTCPRVEAPGLWTPVYGVIRRHTLEKTGRIGPYIGSDTVLLEELLMHGEFLEVPKPLFCKRDHPSRSMRSSFAIDRRIEWYTGQRAPILLFPRWRQLFERLLAVQRTNIRRRDKVGCYWEMIDFCILNYKAANVLINEVWINIRRAFGSR